MRVWLRNSVLLAMVLLVGCRPRGVMSQGKMRDVLYDLHRADAVLQLAGYNYGHDEAVAQYYGEVLRKHGVTQAELDSSLVWYTAHPNRFQRVYPRLIARIQEEQELEKQLRNQESLKQFEVVEKTVLAADTLRLDSVMKVYREGLKLPELYQFPEPYSGKEDSILVFGQLDSVGIKIEGTVEEFKENAEK